jgi:hypothetical protein
MPKKAFNLSSSAATRISKGVERDASKGQARAAGLAIEPLLQLIECGVCIDFR